MFVDRKDELAALRERLGSKEFELVIVYGRRRLGKTTLLFEAVKNRDAVFFTGTKNNNLEKFKLAAGLEKFKSEWGVLLRELKGRVIVLDEYPYILEEDPSIGSELQKIVDFDFSKSGTKLFLCGSVVSVLKENLLEHQAPLYGRKTGQLRLRPIKFLDAAGFYPDAGFSDLLKAYAFSGGVPQYAALVRFPFENWVEKEVARPDSILQDEVEFLVRSEFKKEKSYFSILEAISQGKTTFKEIKEHGKFRETDITPYLNNLMYAELVDSEKPLFHASKNSHYAVNDWFIKFSFNFIYPKKFELSTNQYALDRKGFNTYLGAVFEDVIRRLFAEPRFLKLAGIGTPEKFGRQWGKIPPAFKPEKGKDQYEIDVVAINDKTRELAVAEIKWQDKANAESLARGLNEKTRYLDWHAGKRSETLLVIAKSFAKKISTIDGKTVRCLDLNDLEKLLK